jgi:hypothetical protein
LFDLVQGGKSDQQWCSWVFKSVAFIEYAYIQLSNLKFVEYSLCVCVCVPFKMLILSLFRFCCQGGGRITPPQAIPAPTPLVTSARVIRRTNRHCPDKILTTIFVETIIPEFQSVTIVRALYLKC